MTIKPLLKAIGFLLIPFSFVRRMPKLVEVDLNNPIKRARAARRLAAMGIALVLGAIFGGLLGFYVIGPAVGAIYGTATLFFSCFIPTMLGGGLFAELAVLLTKHTQRFLSWKAHRENKNILAPTYPGKYNFNWHSAIDKYLSSDASKQKTHAQQKIKALYLAKKDIQGKPEGWFGLSPHQQEQCKAINERVCEIKYLCIHSMWVNMKSYSRIEHRYGPHSTQAVTTLVPSKEVTEVLQWTEQEERLADNVRNIVAKPEVGADCFFKSNREKTGFCDNIISKYFSARVS